MSITFDKLGKGDYKGFCNDVKEVFSIAVIETFGQPEAGSEIISSGNEACRILQDTMC